MEFFGFNNLYNHNENIDLFVVMVTFLQYKNKSLKKGNKEIKNQKDKKINKTIKDIQINDENNIVLLTKDFINIYKIDIKEKIIITQIKTILINKYYEKTLR